MGNADRRLSQLETGWGDDEAIGLPDQPRVAGQSREFGILQLLDWCWVVTEHPKADAGERENAGRTVELIATRSVIAGTERRDIYRGQIEWCRNQLRQNGPHPPYSRQIVDLQAAIAADDDTPL